MNRIISGFLLTNKLVLGSGRHTAVSQFEIISRKPACQQTGMPGSKVAKLKVIFAAWRETKLSHYQPCRT
jgi:hypothetical protein